MVIRNKVPLRTLKKINRNITMTNLIFKVDNLIYYYRASLDKQAGNIRS